MKKYLLLLIPMAMPVVASAQNPVSPPGIYLADPSARTWGDGKLYLYGSLDESCDYYCSTRHHLLYTEDMKTWNLAEDIFLSEGERDGVPYNDKLLYAPDAAFRDGVYYLYYCQPDREFSEGVATAGHPNGPFLNGESIDLRGYQQIDPAVFVDDDGQAYYLWGQFTLKMASLMPDMKTLDQSSITDSVLTESGHYFHEGAFMTKRNGIYYLVFADISRGDIPTCLGYATSSKPFGPYTYRGVIVDNNHCNPGNWNNHGSIAEYQNQWYVFYHRSTHGCNTMRKACAEPISFDEHGLIPEVEMTSQGAGGPLDATTSIQAEYACILNGNLRIQMYDSRDEELAMIHSGDKAAFKYIDFGAGADSVRIRLAPLKSGGKIVISLDKPWHKHIGILDIPSSMNGQWQELTFPVEKIGGVHALWLHFYGQDEEMFNIDWITFR